MAFIGKKADPRPGSISIHTIFSGGFGFGLIVFIIFHQWEDFAFLSMLFCLSVWTAAQGILEELVCDLKDCKESLSSLRSNKYA